MKIKAGGVYKVKDKAECVMYSTSDGAAYIRIHTDCGESHNLFYDILDKNRKVINSCSMCFKPEDLIPANDLEDINEGDVLLDPKGGKRLVLGRAGRVVFFSNNTQEPDSTETCSTTSDIIHYCIAELKKDGFKYTDQDEEVPEEMTLSEVCKKLGKVIKIINE